MSYQTGLEAAGLSLSGFVESGGPVKPGDEARAVGGNGFGEKAKTTQVQQNRIGTRRYKTTDLSGWIKGPGNGAQDHGVIKGYDQGGPVVPENALQANTLS
jgi:hypothetical protein